MAPFFETVKSFADVPMEDGIDTAQFLEASDGLVKMFDLLGTGVFSFVQADIRSNIHGLRLTYECDSERCSTLEKVVQNEVHDPKKNGTGCLRRLLRGLLFTFHSLKNSRDNANEDLQASFRRAYDTVLKHHHNFAIRAIVHVALRACPRRQDFYKTIAQGGSPEKLDSELGRWLDGLHAILQRMVVFYEQGGHGNI